MQDNVQFCVGLQHKPGALAQLCGVLRAADVNIDALFVCDDAGACWVNLVTSSPAAAETALKESGYSFSTEPVLMVQIGNHPGALERIAQRLAAERVNINYIYGSGAKDSCLVVLDTSDAGKARAVLKD